MPRTKEDLREESDHFALLDQASFYEQDDDTVYVSADESDMYSRGYETVEGNPRMEG